MHGAIWPPPITSVTFKHFRSPYQILLTPRYLISLCISNPLVNRIFYSMESFGTSSPWDLQPHSIIRQLYLESPSMKPPGVPQLFDPRTNPLTLSKHLGSPFRYLSILNPRISQSSHPYLNSPAYQAPKDVKPYDIINPSGKVSMIIYYFLEFQSCQRRWQDDCC